MLNIFNNNKVELAHIIEWNNRYIIVADYNNKSFKIIYLDENKIISVIGGQHTDIIKSIKRYINQFMVNHYSCGQDKCIKLWTI